MDTSVIPFGDYCYRIVQIRPDEVISTDIDRFGKDLREYRYHGNTKEILCPYWHRTDYGTVQCKFLNIEIFDEDEPKSKKMVIEHFQDTSTIEMIGYSYLLSDEIKICNINCDEEIAI